MVMVVCSACNAHVEDDALHCGLCGAAIAPTSLAPLDKRTCIGFDSSAQEVVAQEAHQVIEPANSQLKTRLEDRLDATLDHGSPLDLLPKYTPAEVDVRQLSLATPIPARSTPLALGTLTPGTKPSPVNQMAASEPPAKRTEQGPLPRTTEQEASGIPPTVEAPRQPARPVPDPTSGALLRITMIAGGLVLIGLFFAPWGQSGSRFVYSWDLLANLDRWQFAQQIYLVAVGLVLVVAGLMPLPVTVRGVTGLILGGVPILTFFVSNRDVQTILVGSLSILMSAALFHRHRCPASLTSRIIVVMGILGITAAFVIPFDGEARWVRVEMTPLGALPLVLPLFCLLSLLVFLGRRSTGWTHLWGAGLMIYLPVSLLLTSLANLVSSPGGFFDQASQAYHALSIGIYFIMTSVGLGHLFTSIRQSTARTC